MDGGRRRYSLSINLDVGQALDLIGHAYLPTPFFPSLSSPHLKYLLSLINAVLSPSSSGGGEYELLHLGRMTGFIVELLALRTEMLARLPVCVPDLLKLITESSS